MGDAKRRKALGLMPAVHPFEAQLDVGAHATLLSGPDDARLRSMITATLEATQLSGDAWASEYRAHHVLAGHVPARLATAEDVHAIPVAPHRRVTGELVVGSSAPETDDVLLPVEGGFVRLRTQQHSHDGVTWVSPTPPRDPQAFLRRVQDNPAFELQGDVIAQIHAEHWLEGRIDLDPEPPDDLLDATEEIVREWHGSTPEDWAAIHRDLGGEGVPVARRTVFELRRPAPLQSPLSRVFAIRQGVEFFALATGASYTLDGEEWITYDPADSPLSAGGLPPELADLFDMDTVSVTVHADGRVEWGDAAVPEGRVDALTDNLRDATGAGDPEHWAAWTAAVLGETYGDELRVPEGAALPVPVAVKLDIPTDALEDDDSLSQTFMESEVTFDGAAWRDLYDEEPPPELAAFRPPTN
ncbi:hypothetical protein HNQ07_000535 [Deinococcus metalli]|uniref:Uncharacterized protein n=1 Tax=Deinococcus metalli TaxID=1141878 RepID=A0A7W8KDL0_9DEIO|nr:hypothetical protein [Deinococcus metalli]MBB5375091.1 hypothetical protein [Deinococcus metalli]GHF31610.1 hypothetical protein GCM10017781_05070 [Deinococcus metalli]